MRRQKILLPVTEDGTPDYDYMENYIRAVEVTFGYADFLNEFVGLFITTVEDKVRGKYSFNYKRSETRLKKVDVACERRGRAGL